MLVLRPICGADLPALIDLVGKAGVGLTTLPPNQQELKKRIEISEASFAGRAGRADELFMFALVESGGLHGASRVAGVSAVAAAVGLSQPWYSYRVGLVVHASQELGIFTRTPTLFLSNDLTGQSELCSLFLDADLRGAVAGKGSGSLLSKARLLFIANERKRFAEKVIAELRGVADAHGKSPFWESLGRHFFSMEFAHADYLTGIGKKSFVAELMPKHPLYTSFLTPEAQAVIGLTHESTRPARALLESEGFRYAGHVDIFDAGPVLECAVEDVHAVALSLVATARVGAAASETSPRLNWLVANTRFADFRAVLTSAPLPESTFALSEEAARALEVVDGDSVRVVPVSQADRGGLAGGFSPWQREREPFPPASRGRP